MASSLTEFQSNQGVFEEKQLWKEILEEVNDSEKNRQSSPTMVFSVIGDSDNFVPRPWPKTVFQTALIEAAKSGGETWILYSGAEQGVSKVVRDAYKNYEDMEFKIERDGKKISDTDRHVKLIRVPENKSNKYPTSTPMDEPKIYQPIPSKKKSFLLSFERFISEQTVAFFSKEFEARMPVPIAVIVCEGDIETIVHISKALASKLPVIIMKGSGAVADIVVDYLENEDLLPRNASSLLGIQFDDANYQKLEKHLRKISLSKNLVGVFDLERDDPLMLSNIVGEAVVSCWSIQKILETIHHNIERDTSHQRDSKTFANQRKMNTETSGFVPLAWTLTSSTGRSKTNIMKNVFKGLKESRPYVLNPKYTTPTSLPLYFYFGYQLMQGPNSKQKAEKWGHILLLEALKANRCDYVRVLIDRGIDLQMIDLPELYEQTVSCQKCEFNKTDCLHMQWILKQIQETQAKTLCQEVKEKKNEKQSSGSDSTNLPRPVADAARGLCREMLRYKECGNSEKEKEDNYAKISDILLWAIFANRRDLAEICWLKGKDHLLTGLICSAILRKLSKKANNVKEQMLSIDLEEHSKLFEQRCIELMDSMYKEDSEHAIDLMDDEAEVWGITSSPLTFAYENFMYDIVAHTCSQKLINKEWYNNLTPDFKPFLKSAFRKPIKFFTAPLTKYVFNYGCLESRGRSHRNYYSRMKRYLYDFWNVVDLLSYALLITALCVRHFHPSENFTVARRMFSLSLLVMYLRFLEVFLIHRKMGPTLIMIKEMLKDLLRFLFLAVFVVLGVGIYYHANLWPDHQTVFNGDWTNWRIWTIIYYPYWQLYGELNLESLDGSDHSDCTNVTAEWESDTAIERCPREDWTVLAVAGIYMLFSNLLLVNLVIAMFSYTFERVQNDSEKLWRFERYAVINDYDWRIPSPINLLFLPYRFLCCPSRKDCCLQQCKSACDEKGTKKKLKKRKMKLEFRQNFQKIIALKNHNTI